MLKTFKMETKIQKTLNQWFPEAFANAKKTVFNSDYETLQQFAEYTLKLISENRENKKEPFKIINLIYANGSLHDKNAIENEFFTKLSKIETPATLNEHLNLMPKEIRTIYIKTIIEN
ncbi:MAG: hypothetical protein CVU00_10290 [Bacteroidetes bacterium HGW-Bacteroidetes-17]|nr:MAG: hypothetical protein CVU00_10290 [Bacteroidetes bacterium HGW-Bacteroidetes-17]